ncbi:MAG TPA: PIG-L deacetylase family protein [Candidatus Saccharimonadales bacterium]|nr:PIG-L deacetylase family protein [Candidatus Saccharimonadales bacterium]
MKSFTPKRVLGIAAHPDDLDFGVSGSMAAWSAAGTDCYYLVLTNGNKGTADTSLSPEQLTKIRRKEQRVAAKLLGVKDVFFLDYEDGGLEVTMGLKKDIVRVIRTVKPDTVIAMDPSMLYAVERGFINHPDHRASGQAALDAVYPLARDHLSFPDLFTEEKLAPHKVTTLLLINFEKHNFYVDITATLDKKLAALAAHKSQMPDLAGTQTMMKNIGRELGRVADCEYAEAFFRIDVTG